MNHQLGAALIGVMGLGLVPACADEPAILERSDELVKTPPPAPDDGACTVVTSAFDVVVPRVQVSGDFRINGAVPVAYDSQSGIVELRSETLGVVELGSVNAGSYTRWVIPGAYQVVYRHVQGDLVPQNAESVVLDEVVLDSNTTLDISLTSVLVMGAITLNGGPAPAGFYEQGQIRLRDRATGAAFPVGRSIDGEYFAMVMPGLYDVVWSRMAGGSVVPANTDAVLIEEVTVAGLTELDVDVPAVVRTGNIRIDGGAPSTSVYQNGWVLLRDTRTGDVVPLGKTRDQTYSKVIVPGTYDILYSHLIGSTHVPQNELAVIATNVALTTDGDLTINIPTVTVSGTLSLDGGDFPGGIYNRARIWLQGADPADRFIAGTTNVRTYQVRVIPGTYDVAYQRLLSTGLVPENTWAVISRDHVIAKPKGLFNPGPVTLDVDVTSGWLAADVTVWGQPPLASIYEQGEILAMDDAGEATSLGSTIDGELAIRLLSGSYAFHYGHLIGSMPANGDALVGQDTTHAIATPGSLDLQPGTLSGSFLQANHPFPANPSHHGVVALRDLETGDLFVLGDTADGTYQMPVLTGDYELVYDYVEGTTVVANRDATLGCITFAPLPPLAPLPPPSLTRH